MDRVDMVGCGNKHESKSFNKARNRLRTSLPTSKEDVNSAVSGIGDCRATVDTGGAFPAPWYMPISITKACIVRGIICAVAPESVGLYLERAT